MGSDLPAAVVTGAGQGLGAAIALAFAASGRPVMVADLRYDLAEHTAAAIINLGGEARPLEVDASDEADVSRLGQSTEDSWGPLGVWVNNAGLTRPALLHKMEVSDFDRVLAVHARGTFLGIREAARRMLSSESSGCILNVTSSAGLQGTIGQINYAAAKGAVVSATKSAALELARYGIRVNAVAPLAATPMTEKIRTDPGFSSKFLDKVPLRRFGNVEEIAAMFVYLSSEQATYVTGQVVCIDGGLYMAN
jgi:3-oxoacyl-[acyl-carrier protein] reductase